VSTFVFADDDGNEYLVTFYFTDSPAIGTIGMRATLALRPKGQRSWGPPLQMRRQVT
jgi:hypothetical protein